MGTDFGMAKLRHAAFKTPDFVNTDNASPQRPIRPTADALSMACFESLAERLLNPPLDHVVFKVPLLV
jgi:hypothetical protein